MSNTTNTEDNYSSNNLWILHISYNNGWAVELFTSRTKALSYLNRQYKVIEVRLEEYEDKQGDIFGNVVIDNRVNEFCIQKIKINSTQS